MDSRLAGDEHTIHGGHDEANLRGVGGAGEVGVDLLRLVLIQRHEAVEDVITGRGVVGASWRSAVSHTSWREASRSSPS